MSLKRSIYQFTPGSSVVAYDYELKIATYPGRVSKDSFVLPILRRVQVIGASREMACLHYSVESVGMEY